MRLHARMIRAQLDYGKSLCEHCQGMGVYSGEQGRKLAANESARGNGGRQCKSMCRLHPSYVDAMLIGSSKVKVFYPGRKKSCFIKLSTWLLQELPVSTYPVCVIRNGFPDSLALRMMSFLPLCQSIAFKAPIRVFDLLDRRPVQAIATGNTGHLPQRFGEQHQNGWSWSPMAYTSGQDIHQYAFDHNPSHVLSPKLWQYVNELKDKASAESDYDSLLWLKWACLKFAREQAKLPYIAPRQLIQR